MIAAKVILIIAIAFAALSLACAVWIGRRRPPSADPFSAPFGEMPFFTAEQLNRLTPRWDPADPLRRSFAVRDRLKREAQPLFLIRQANSGGVANLPDAGGGGFSSYPLGPAAARIFSWWRIRK